MVHADDYRLATACVWDIPPTMVMGDCSNTYPSVFRNFTQIIRGIFVGFFFVGLPLFLYILVYVSGSSNVLLLVWSSRTHIHTYSEVWHCRHKWDIVNFYIKRFITLIWKGWSRFCIWAQSCNCAIQIKRLMIDVSSVRPFLNLSVTKGILF